MQHLKLQLFISPLCPERASCGLLLDANVVSTGPLFPHEEKYNQCNSSTSERLLSSPH